MFPLGIQIGLLSLARRLAGSQTLFLTLVTSLVFGLLVVSTTTAFAQESSKPESSVAGKSESEGLDQREVENSAAAASQDRASASRSVVSMLLSFTFVDNLLEAATRSPERLPEIAKVEPAFSKAISQVSLGKKQDPPASDSKSSAEPDTPSSSDSPDDHSATSLDSKTVANLSAAELSGDSSTTDLTPEVQQAGATGQEAVVEHSESQQRAVRSVRMLVVALGIIAIVGLVRLLLHLNQLAHGNYAGRLQFIGWVGVTVILVVSLGVALNEDLWDLSANQPPASEKLVSEAGS